MIPGEVLVGGAAPLLPGLVRRVVTATLSGEGKEASVSVTFLSTRRMQELNADYKGHDAPTDVISFPLAQPDGSVLGDIYVCRRMAAQEAGFPIAQ